MLYGFYVESESKSRACLVRYLTFLPYFDYNSTYYAYLNNSIFILFCFQPLPKDYSSWIKKFNYPVGNTEIRTLDSQVFVIKIMELNGTYYLYNGWRTMIQTLNYPSKCKFVFQHVANQKCFRMISFYQDAVCAPGPFFYCRLDDPFSEYKHRLVCLIINLICYTLKFIQYLLLY